MKVNKEAIIQFAKKSRRFASKNRKYILTGILSFLGGIVFLLTVAGIAAADDPEYIEYTEYEKVYEKMESYANEVSNYSATIQELSAEKKELQAKVDEAAPWFKMTDEEKKKTEAEAKAAEEKRLAEEKAKKEAEEKAKKEAEEKAKAEAEAKEKQGYNTGITYDQLARTPDKYLFEKVKFRGKVVQVMEGDGTTTIRLAVNDNYDTIIYGEYDSSVVDSRILEDDWITIYGTSAGLITYESTMGGQISIPGVSIDKIDQ